MVRLPKSIQTLIDELSSLPGIGPKSAARLTFYLISKNDGYEKNLGEAIRNLKENLKRCSVCFNYGETDPCEICEDNDRDRGLVAVVEEPLDVIALDKAGHKGLYHVLGGVISPIAGVSPDDLTISALLDRVANSSDRIREVILATNPTLEGEATAVYISESLKSSTVKATRLARGLPSGGDLEYADEATLSRSLEGRKEI